MRVYYPKLRNLLSPFDVLLLPKDQTFIFYSWFVINRDHQGFCYSKECRNWHQGWRIDNDPNFKAVGLARHLEENGIGKLALFFAL